MSAVRVQRQPRRLSLFWRLFARYVSVLALAVAALVFAPIRVSVPTRAPEVAVLLAGFAIVLVVYSALLRRVLAPLERLTGLMRRIDPLTPGRRIDVEAADAEVIALAQAFNDMLDRLETERRESARRSLAAQEAERRRIARELHDEIGQTLTGLVLRSEAIMRHAPDEVQSDMRALQETARRGAEDVRSIARRLRPEALDELGLHSALLALVASVQRGSGLEITTSIARSPDLTSEQELVVYRIAQESLTNIARHAHASRVELMLEDAQDVVLSVRDDGIGLPPRSDGDLTGIRGMRERALLVGAELAIRSSSGRGTEIRLRLPR
jgi:two-component system sensor histidine kinase UhpB